jgi:hypothetical protein
MSGASQQNTRQTTNGASQQNTRQTTKSLENLTLMFRNGHLSVRTPDGEWHGVYKSNSYDRYVTLAFSPKDTTKTTEGNILT